MGWRFTSAGRFPSPVARHTGISAAFLGASSSVLSMFVGRNSRIHGNAFLDSFDRIILNDNDGS